MKFNLLYLTLAFACITVTSCELNNNSQQTAMKKGGSNAQYKFDETVIPENHALVLHSPPNKEAKEILKYSMVDLYQETRMKIESKKLNYFSFVGITTQSMDRDSINASIYRFGKPEIEFIKFTNQCFFHRGGDLKDSTSVFSDQFDFSFIVNNLVNSVTGSDSMYLQLEKGGEFVTIPAELKTRSFSYFTNEDPKTYSLKYPIPIFRSQSLTTDKNKQISLLVGFIAYDCTKNLDHDRLVNSSEFARFVSSDIYHDKKLAQIENKDDWDFIKISNFYK